VTPIGADRLGARRAAVGSAATAASRHAPRAAGVAPVGRRGVRWVCADFAAVL